MFTAQTKKRPAQEIYLNITEIKRLFEFAKASRAQGGYVVKIVGSETGIGRHIQVSDNIGATKDISDYSSW